MYMDPPNKCEVHITTAQDVDEIQTCILGMHWMFSEGELNIIRCCTSKVKCKFGLTTWYTYTGQFYQLVSLRIYKQLQI